MILISLGWPWLDSRTPFHLEVWEGDLEEQTNGVILKGGKLV